MRGQHLKLTRVIQGTALEGTEVGNEGRLFSTEQEPCGGHKLGVVWVFSGVREDANVAEI